MDAVPVEVEGRDFDGGEVDGLFAVFVFERVKIVMAFMSMTINLSVNIQKSTYLKVKFGAKLHALAHSPTNNDHRKIKIEPWPYVTSLLAVGLA